MKRLVIAIDCDDVLVPGTEFSVTTYNRNWGTNVALAQAHSLDHTEWDASEEEIRRRFDKQYLSDEYKLMKPYEEAIEVVVRLAGQHELHLVTARPETIMSVTEYMVEQYFPGCFTSIRHVGLDGSKGDICEALQADVLIDDNLRHLVSAKGCGVDALFWFGDYPWQTKTPEQSMVTARCYDWPSVEAEIAKLAA